MQGRLSNLVRWLVDAINKELEVVIVFDGCEDQTESELESLGFKESHNLRLLHTKGLGAGEARNLGFQAATRKWVVFWDSDDVGDIAALQEAVAVYLKPGTHLGICQYRIAPFGTSTSELQFLTPSITLNIETALYTPAIWRMIFNREFAVGCDFGRKNIGEDQVFLAHVLSKNPNIQFFTQSIYIYFQGIPGQLTSRKLDSQGLLENILAVKVKIAETHGATQELLYLIALKMSLTLFKSRYFTKFLQAMLALFINSDSKPRIQSIIYLSRAFLTIIRTREKELFH